MDKKETQRKFIVLIVLFCTELNRRFKMFHSFSQLRIDVPIDESEPGRF